MQRTELTGESLIRPSVEKNVVRRTVKERESILVDRPVFLSMQSFRSSKALLTVNATLVHPMLQVGKRHLALRTNQQLMMPGAVQREQIAIERDQFAASFAALVADQIVVARCSIHNLHPASII